jgi:hypothetical protein
MPYDDPDPTDPQVLVGVALPSSEEAAREMAYVFAEEFARMGMDAREVLSLFTNPFYAGAHQIYRALGADAVRGIVEECIAVWGRTVGRIQDNQMPNTQGVPECGMRNDTGPDQQLFPIPDSEIRIVNSGGA